jgi:glutathione synthase/RimK-type ligase-like ATP-grasp enzyme
MLLIVTEKWDPHADWVEEELNRRSLNWVRFHLSDFPTAAHATYSAGSDSDDASLTVRGTVIPLSSVDGVWYRRTETFGLPDSLSAVERGVAQAECREFVQGLWSQLASARWLSAPPAIRAASSKAEQLLRACRFGFEVPETCVSNEPDAIRAFVDAMSHRGERVIYKPHTTIIVEAENGRVGVAYTRLLGAAELERLAEIRLTPGIFQRYVPKRLELRVTVIGTSVFACAIDSQGRSATQVDWRASPWESPGEFPAHVPFALPSEFADMCSRFVHSYGLAFGAIDLVVTPGGEYVFLELNPNGQWAWVEQMTGLPMRAALVDELTGARGGKR